MTIDGGTRTADPDHPSPDGADDPSDAALIARVARTIQRPRLEMADSFVLHAPLELAARAALLPWVAPEARHEARRRIAELGRAYEDAGDGVPEPPSRDFASTVDAVARLGAAVDAGDLDEVDAVAAWLGHAGSPAGLRTLLADLVVPRLSAAAHAPIFLFQLPRVSPRGELPATLLRPLVRELARFPDWRLTWHEDLAPRSPDLHAGALFDAIAATPRPGLPGSDFIYPIMSQVDGDIAGDVLGDVVGRIPPREAALAIMRAAASSMLQEPTDWAPYGWSHCLTLPQAVLGIADACSDPMAPVAVAATFVVGFRAALSEQPMVAGTTLPQPSASATQIASYAATHHDAHLVKYTLACLDAAAWDRSHADLYVAAAEKLCNHWHEQALAC